jgi:hypothetical protein
MAIRMAYVNDRIVCCRLRGIYGAIRHENYNKAKVLVNDMLVTLRTADIEMNDTDYNKTVDTFYHTLVEIAMKRYQGAHNNIRSLYYDLMTPYIYSLNGGGSDEEEDDIM